MYHSELARSGKALFTIRGSYIYVVIAGSIAIAWLTRDPGPFASEGSDQLWFCAGIIVALSAALWRVVIGGFAALGTSGNAKKEAVAAELNTTGPYSVVRNPLYVGRIVNFTGLAMLSGSWEYTALVYLVSVLIYERISIYEEQFLASKFGDAHRAWAESVPALLPRLHGWIKPKYPFWWRRAIRREYKKLFQLATAIFVCQWAHDGFAITQDMTAFYIYGGIVVIRLAIGAARQFGKVFDGIE